MPTHCPDEGTLRAYLDRQLPAGEQAKIAAHLNGCPNCAQAAAALQAQADATNAALAQVAVPQASTSAAWQRFSAQHTMEQPVSSGRERRAPTRALYIWHTLVWRFRAMSRNAHLRWQPALIGMVLAALLISLVAVAPLRAAAGQFLEIFRVQKLAVVQVNPSQMEKLQNAHDQIFTQPQVQQAEAIHATSAAQASQAAGFKVLTPEFVPGSLGAPKELVVQPGGHAKTEVNLKAARTLLQMANLPTNAIPADRDSIEVNATLKPAAAQHYQSSDGQMLNIAQATSPEVDVPDGVDLSRIGEVGLEFLGMSPEAAQRFSRSIDWSTTLVLPIPQNMASVQEVTVRNTTGYLITGINGPKAKSGTPQSALVWQENGQVFMVEGSFGQQVLLRVAESLK